MNSAAYDALTASVVSYCASLGSDPLLVQGAGGNFSWKNGDTMWVKASGTCLAEAQEKAIFLPVDLEHLRAAIEEGDFFVLPRVRGESDLRPSIETLIHALMPHRFVMHLHPVEIVSHLVRDRCHVELRALLDVSISWALVDYHRPGAALARAVSAALANHPDTSVVFLKNHGVVIGGDDVEELRTILNFLISRLATRPSSEVAASGRSESVLPIAGRRYCRVGGDDIQKLAFEPLFCRLKRDWALYPDHVVFLGHAPVCYDSLELLSQELTGGANPEFFFLKDEGVFATGNFGAAKQAQLQCYYQILVRQPDSALLNVLDGRHVADLLNWDAELYRLHLTEA